MTIQEQIKEIMPVINGMGIKTKLIYTKIETATILGVSTQTLDRMCNLGVGLKHKKIVTNSRTNNGRVMFPISEIARYYFDNIQTA
ncbi:hypothetical protein [Sulfurospirillum sp. 1612]|uniref:hypothetical protein n=1 Tax=Sulfurospirillum sp. 1612 TaxID=3094835 RepID=UPI002F957E77